MARQKLKPRTDGRYQTSVMFRGERVWFLGEMHTEAAARLGVVLGGRS